jgi:hypothetical protein
MSQPKPFRLALAVVGGLVIGLGCTGKIMDGRGQGQATGQATGAAAGSGAGASGNVTGSGGAGNVGGVVPPPPPNLVFAPEPSSLRRLTVAQYQASIRDVFGAAIPFSTELEPDTELSGFSSIGAATVGLSAHATEQFETVALEIAQKALADPARRMALGGCAPAGVTDDACTRKVLQTVGRRAWRRPLTDEETGRFLGVARNAQTVLNDWLGGLAYGVSGLLQSPFFLYRVELGATDAKDPSRVVLDDYEVATRLAYFLWSTTPDDALLDAAGARQLLTGAGLATQAQRLLASPRAAEGMQTFFTELYRLQKLDSMPQLASKFPLVTPTLGASMRTETLRVLDDVAFGRDADFREIFDSRATFVNGELAKLYGLTGITGANFVPAMLPATGPRAGLLGHASFLAVSSTPTRGSATRRGKFIREMVLCQGIPAAPPDIEPLPETGGGTAKQRLTTHRTVASCAACHVKMDPIGLALENFDGIGAYRTTDAGQTIDASGDLDGMAFSSPVELAALLKNHPNSATCVARNVFRYALGHLEGNGEADAIQQITKGFSDGGYRFKALLTAVTASPSFIYAGKPTP